MTDWVAWHDAYADEHSDLSRRLGIVRGMVREALRDRAAHAGPIDEDTLVYRIELHAVSPED